MGVFEKLENEMLKEAKEYAFKNAKDRVVRLGEVSALVALAGILISIGVAQLIGFFFPILNNGYNYLLLAFLYLLVAYVLKK